MQDRATATQRTAQRPASELMPGLLEAVRRAERQAHPLSVLVLSIETPADYDVSDAIAWAVDAIERSIRRYTDWMATWTSAAGATCIAVVLPQTGPRQVAAVRRRMREMLHAALGSNPELKFSLGAASLDELMVNRHIEVSELLAVADKCRQCALTRGGCHLDAVRLSVANGVALSCRDGYAVAELCSEAV